MDLELDGSAAVVSASSSGLGKASATALAREGADVVVNGREPHRLEAAVAAIGEVAAGEVVGCRADITDVGDVSRLVATAVEEFGRLDHLVTNAGPPPRLRFPETTDDDWYQAYDLLVMSAVRLVRESIPHLRADGGGTIVTITSRIVKEPSPANVLSSAVRMAVTGLGKTLSRELAPDVRVNAVLPGKHDTPRRVDGDRDPGDAVASSTVRQGGPPVGRIGDPIELGDVVAFLCSRRAGYVNGAAVQIDGGTIKSAL